MAPTDHSGSDAGTFRSDWLASQPLFYNTASGKISRNVNDVIDFNDFDFHPEGFNNYLDFGYSVFEQTPVKHVKFLRHSSLLVAQSDDGMKVESFEDVLDGWLHKTSDEEEVWHLLEASIRNWEDSVKGEIIIPTSGGYDSRLLNLLVKDKSRIRAFSYGVADNQADCDEVVYARKLSELLGVKWKQIALGDLHRYLDDWDKLFGVSTHAHGMYHIEFYRKIKSEVREGSPLLSGIIGDAWAGSVNIPAIKSPSDVRALGYSHGMNATSEMSLLASKPNLLEEYYEKNRDRLASPLARVVESMRFKIVLLSYLFTIPRSLGFKPWSPFLLPEIALSMLMLPAPRREQRVWQTEYFRRHHLALEEMNLKVDVQNTLALQSMRKIRLAPLDVSVLREVVAPRYVEWINRMVSHVRRRDLFWRMARIKGIRGLMYRAGISDQRVKAYNAYMTLKPIESLLKRRNRLAATDPGDV